ncbi:unnamed protein product [Sphagnum troendelagicum]|uniref:HMA domain-containing protein n=1 Tax=Sphagnum troendelagicum TaxID=128251 RepID=A0ABP0URF1_9BRYO
MCDFNILQTDVKMVVLRVMMHFEGCASTVKRAVKRIPGITSYQADFPGQKVTVMGSEARRSFLPSCQNWEIHRILA